MLSLPTSSNTGVKVSKKTLLAGHVQAGFNDSCGRRSSCVAAPLPHADPSEGRKPDDGRWPTIRNSPGVLSALRWTLNFSGWFVLWVP
jgi:hypothetical protein